MKSTRIFLLVLAVLMVMSTFAVCSFAETQDIQETKTTTINYGTPLVDGLLDDVWGRAVELNFHYDRNNCSESDLAAPLETPVNHWAKALWDNDNLYVYFRVFDENVYVNGLTDYIADGVEVYIEEENVKGYQNAWNDSVQVCINPTAGGGVSQKAYLLSEFVTKIDADGGYYDVEVSIPFKKITPADGVIIGFDLAINANDNGIKGVGKEKRDHNYSWNDTTNTTFMNTVYMGNAVLDGYDLSLDVPDVESPSVSLWSQKPESGAVHSGYCIDGDGNPTNIKFEVYGQSDTGYTIYFFMEDPNGDSVVYPGINTGGYFATDGDKWNCAYNSYAHLSAYYSEEYDVNLITKAVFGDGITELGGDKTARGILSGLTALTTVEFPASLTKMVSATFETCPALSTVYTRDVGQTVEEGTVNLSNFTHMNFGIYAFANCRSVQKYVFAESVTTDTPQIGQFCFGYSSVLKSLNIPDGITGMDSDVFFGDGAMGTWTLCPINEITIHGANTEISAATFNNCYSLATIKAPAKSPAYTFALYSGYDTGDDVSLFDPTLPTCGPSSAFGFDEATGTLTVYGLGKISDIVNYYGGGSKHQPWFSIRDNVKHIIISDGITSIGKYAFCQFTNLETVQIPASDNFEILSGAFEKCSKLKSVYLSGTDPIEGTVDIRNVHTINPWTFAYDFLIANVIISPKVEKIGTSVFEENITANLANVYGTPGSYAESYAAENGLTFNDISASAPQPITCTPPEPTVLETDTDAPDTTVLETEAGAPETTVAPEPDAEQPEESVDAPETSGLNDSQQGSKDDDASTDGNSDILPIIIIAALVVVAAVVVAIIVAAKKKKK